ncbi:MAG: hypothetical protein Q8941_08840 [Bacteroidota bacterium]|nr:hypothetical protein [Bacteroidota bacterium]
MTVQQFKKTITKASGFDKYYYYFISFLTIGFGVAFLFKSLTLTEHREEHSQAIMLFASLFCFLLGSIALYLVRNRYKILTFDSNSSTEDKKRIIADTIKDFNSSFIDNSKGFWSFNYRRNWWTSDYTIYLTFDNDNIFASVIASTYYHGGFIDFGQTERIRQKLNTVILQKLQTK